jgi:cytochrome c biogenesis protein CcdA
MCTRIRRARSAKVRAERESAQPAFSGNNGRVLRLIGLVVSIGLADSLNPSTIAPALYIAAGDRPRRSLLQFTLAVFAVYLIGGVVVVLGPGQLLLSLVPTPGRTARYIAELVAGVVMLLAAGFLWHDRKGLAHHDLPEPPAEGKSSALLGVTITAVELPTAFPYFAAIAAIVGSGLDPERQTILLVLYNVCFVLPLIMMLATLAIAGDGAEELLSRARDQLQRHWPTLLAGLALLAGVFVTLLGVTGLAAGGHGVVARFSRRLRRVISH